ncbi:hypothetical protein BH10BAC3_BH10BAC3_11870 [soil metagenome]
MSNQPFSILVNYNKKLVIAEVLEINDQLQFQYRVTFPDGFTNVFHTYETEGTGGWAEESLDAT